MSISWRRKYQSAVLKRNLFRMGQFFKHTIVYLHCLPHLQRKPWTKLWPQPTWSGTISPLLWLQPCCESSPAELRLCLQSPLPLWTLPQSVCTDMGGQPLLRQGSISPSKHTQGQAGDSHGRKQHKEPSLSLAGFFFEGPKILLCGSKSGEKFWSL